MYKVAKEFSDLLNGLHNYKVGDNYVEIDEKWTAYLAGRGLIEKVKYEKKYEAVQEKQN